MNRHHDKFDNMPINRKKMQTTGSGFEDDSRSPTAANFIMSDSDVRVRVSAYQKTGCAHIHLSKKSGSQYISLTPDEFHTLVEQFPPLVMKGVLKAQMICRKEGWDTQAAERKRTSEELNTLVDMVHFDSDRHDCEEVECAKRPKKSDEDVKQQKKMKKRKKSKVVDSDSEEVVE